MKKAKSLEEFRAEKLGYVYFSRLKNLQIHETPSGDKLNYLIDIGDDLKQTGRFFGVEVKDYLHKDIVIDDYANMFIPSLLVLFDNATNKGFYKWILKPVDGGKLVLDKNDDVRDFTTESLKGIVNEISVWYAQRQVA